MFRSLPTCAAIHRKALPAGCLPRQSSRSAGPDLSPLSPATVKNGMHPSGGSQGSASQAIAELRSVGGSGVVVSPVSYIFEEEPAEYQAMLKQWRMEMLKIYDSETARKTILRRIPFSSMTLIPISCNEPLNYSERVSATAGGCQIRLGFRRKAMRLAALCDC